MFDSSLIKLLLGGGDRILLKASYEVKSEKGMATFVLIKGSVGKSLIPQPYPTALFHGSATPHSPNSLPYLTYPAALPHGLT